MPAPNLQTKRLILRHWREADLDPFAELNADPKVLEYFPTILFRQESDELAKKIEAELQEKPYGLWAVEKLEDAQFIGFVGLHEQTFPAHFTPCIEIGWRLARHAWGKGYAYEAASKVIDYAAQTLKLKEIVSFASEHNRRSIKLMKKLEMTRDPKDDFEHPNLKEGHPLRSHVLYRKQL